MWALRQSTAGQVIPLGPFLDSTDGNTAETGLTIANTDIKLQKFGATSEVTKNSGGATHIASGRYYATLDATDSNTIGPMRISVHVAGALAVWLDCEVLSAAVYDVKFGTTAPSTYAGGAVASVTGAVGSVTGNVGGNVNGSVASVAGNVGGNVSGSVGSVTGAVGSVTGAVGSVTGNLGGNVVGSTASVSGAVGSVTGNVGGNVAGKVLGGGGGTISGDGVRAESVTGAVGSVTGAVGSVTGNVGGTVAGQTTALTNLLAAVYDTLTVSGNTLNLSNGKAQTVDAAGNRTLA